METLQHAHRLNPTAVANALGHAGPHYPSVVFWTVQNFLIAGAVLFCPQILGHFGFPLPANGPLGADISLTIAAPPLLVQALFAWNSAHIGDAASLRLSACGRFVVAFGLAALVLLHQLPHAFMGVAALELASALWTELELRDALRPLEGVSGAEAKRALRALGESHPGLLEDAEGEEGASRVYWSIVVLLGGVCYCTHALYSAVGTPAVPAGSPTAVWMLVDCVIFAGCFTIGISGVRTADPRVAAAWCMNRGGSLSCYVPLYLLSGNSFWLNGGLLDLSTTLWTMWELKSGSDDDEEEDDKED